MTKGKWARIAHIAKGNSGIIVLGAYKYPAGFYKCSKRGIIIRLGCFHRTIDEWDNDFNNNPDEFPPGSPELQKREEAYKCLKAWALSAYAEKESNHVPDPPNYGGGVSNE